MIKEASPLLLLEQSADIQEIARGQGEAVDF